MGDPPWKRRRHPFAEGISIEPFSPRSMDSRSSSRVGSVEAASPELDFTDKLRALRELIASSKSRRHAREESSNKSSGVKIMARRQNNLCEAREVGGHIQFSVNSCERHQWAERLRRSLSRRKKEILDAERVLGNRIDVDILKAGGELYPEDLQELDLLLSSDSWKYLHRRPHSAAESYSHLLSRDLKELSLAREKAWAGVDLGFDSSSQRECLGKDGLPDSRRPKSSLDHLHHEVPERDWSSPATTRSVEDLHKKMVDGVMSAPGLGYNSHDVPVVLPASDIRSRELMKEKASVYKQYSPRDSLSPPEHDIPSAPITPRPFQTNVHLSADPPAKPDKPRARSCSADHGRLHSEKTVSSAQDLHSIQDDQHQHWTRLLSQKRDKSESRSVPSSPLTMQSGVSLEPSQPTSTHVLMLQEALRHLQRENHQLRQRQKDRVNDESKEDREEAQQDSEVAQIMQHPSTRKIIIKRGSVRVVQNAGSMKPQQTSNRKPSPRNETVHHKSKLYSLLVDASDGSVQDMTKDDHLLTLDKLRSLLKGRRVESRPSSQTSSASVSSPAPLRAMHLSSHLHQQETEDMEKQSDGKTSESTTSRPVQRKIIRRPPTVPQAKKKIVTSLQRFAKDDQKGEESRAYVEDWAKVGSQVLKETRSASSQRPSSASHLSSRLTSSSLSSSTKSLASVTRNSQGSNAGSKTSLSSYDEKKRRERPRSSTDITTTIRDEDVLSAQNLRSNVQRLHQEVSLRVSQEAYIIQGLMKRAESLNMDISSDHKQVAEPGQIRQKLSFDEEATPFAVKEERRGSTGSLRCFPIGKRLGAGMVDTGCVPKLSSLNAGGFSTVVNGTVLKEKLQSGKEFKAEQAACTSVDEDSSFLANVVHMSTSTPRHGEKRQRPSSSLAPAVGGRSGWGSVVLERETASNLRLKRPASVGAIPFPFFPASPAVLTGNDAADVIVSQLGNASMVHLLQQLYTADDATRQAIILKAQYFKQWQNIAQSLKRQRQLYTDSLKRAYKFLISRLQHRCFYHWRGAAEDRRKRRLAECIQRRHMLRKGLQAFHWAILRSKHQIRTLQVKVHAIITRAAFAKWQARFESRREERLQTAFRRWQEYTYEEKIIREKQRDQNAKLVYVTMLLWREAFDRRLKENIADSYLRHTSLWQCWREWRHFTRWAKEKACRHSVALDMRKHNQQWLTMRVWRVALVQSQKASQHFRKRRLHRIIQAWRHGAEISHVERQHDMAISLEHWQFSTTKHTFHTWHYRLLMSRAITMADNALCRKTFEFWHQSWQINTQRRQQVESLITRSRLRKTLMTWRWHIVDRRRKQRQAVFLLEMCLMRGILCAWRAYTTFKADFRASLQQQVMVIERAVLSRCFDLWKAGLHARLDERWQQQLRSMTLARKVTAHWRRKCHIHRLTVTLHVTEPVRHLALLRRMFLQWQSAKCDVDTEKREAQSCQQLLQRCCLQRRFQQWRLATHRALTIRPLVNRRHRQLLTWCFDAWHQLVHSKQVRVRCQKLFQKTQLARAFNRWRRQYHCQQVSLLAGRTFLQRLTLCLLQEWRHILQRKHCASHSHAASLLTRSFTYWKARTHRQLRDKAWQQAIQERSRWLKQQYLQQWWSGVRAQVTDDSDTIARLQQRHHHNHIYAAFHTWRRALHAHIISREYQRTATLRLLHSVLLEWHEATCQALRIAVQCFAQQLGLTQLQGEGEEEAVGFAGGEESGDEGDEEFQDLLHSGDREAHVSNRFSSAASFRRVFASDQSTTSERMCAGDLDRASLLASGLQETMEERRQKNLRLQGLSMLFVTRLCHWPVSMAFSQWQNYTLRHCQLRKLAQEVGEKHQALAVRLTFRRWSFSLDNSRKATSLRNWNLQHGTLTSLLEYSQHCKVKAVLAERARIHLVKHVLGRIFPWWLEKAQEQRHQRTVLHLWSTSTPQEAELLPLEGSLSRQIRHRSLRTCLLAWRVRFLFLVGLKRVYHAQLLGRVLCSWQEWASLRQHQRKKGENFLQARRKSLAFRAWCERVHQKRETERRYRAVLDTYLRQALSCWRHWATVNRHQRQSRVVVEAHVNQVCMRTHFLTWYRLTHHALSIRTVHHTNLLRSVLLGWRQATEEGKRLRQTILSFQAQTLTSLVGQLFALWKQRYHHCQQQYMQREERAQLRALYCAQHWRHLAQKTRGRKLLVAFKYSRLYQMFCHWRASLARVEGLKDRLSVLVAGRNADYTRRVLHKWRQRLQSVVLLRAFTLRLAATLLQAWKAFARGSKECRIRGLALQHALQERNLRVYFLYWRQMSLRVRSLQNNVEVRLQLRVLQAWHYITRRRCSQRRLREKFERVCQERHLAAAFYTLSTRFDYCQGLRDMADSMHSRRQRRLALAALGVWKDALDSVVAVRFYQRLVCLRAARTWVRFVLRVKAERQHEEQQTQRALTHHHRSLCRSILEALKTEVKVKRQLQQRQQRIAIKFASSWKCIADLSATAVIVAEERLYRLYWRCWRLAYVRCQAANRDAALHHRQLLSQVFTAWLSVCPCRQHTMSQEVFPGRHTVRIMPSESEQESPTTPRSFLPVPIVTSRR